MNKAKVIIVGKNENAHMLKLLGENNYLAEKWKEFITAQILGKFATCEKKNVIQWADY